MSAGGRSVEPGTAERTTAVRLKSPAPVPVPPAYRQVPFLETLAPATWRDVLAACGVDAPKSTDGGFAAALFELLGEEQPAMLIDALETISEVGNEEGAEVLRELEEGVSAVLPDDFPHDATVQEQAARLWCLAQREEAVARRLIVAQAVILARQRKRPTLHFAGASPRRPKPMKRALPSLRKLLGEIFERRGAGGYLEIDEVPQDDDRLVLYVVHGSTRRSVVTVNEAETGRERKDVRPAVSDIISYESETARLELQLASVHVANDYRRALGVAVFDDPKFFAGGGGWDLTPLQRRRAAVLESAPLSVIESAVLRSCIWAPSSGGRIVLSDPDVFDLVERHGLRFEDGEIVEARFAMRVRATGRRRRVTATIKPTNQLLCDDRYRADVTAYFTELGLRSGPSVVDLWSLGEGVHREAAWRAVLGAEGVREAIAEKILVPGKIAHASLDGVTSSDIVEDDDADIRIDDDGSAHRLSDADRHGYRLDATALGRRLAHRAGIVGALTETHAGLLDLGRVKIGEHVVKVILAHRDPGIRDAVLRDAARPRDADRVVVLAPPGRSMSGIDVAPLDHVLSPHRLLGRIATALELAQYLPAIETAPAGARLVVDDVTNTVWLDDVELNLTVAQFALVRAAALAAERKRSPSTELMGSASLGSKRGDRAAKKTKSETLARIRECFERANLALPPELAGKGTLLESRGNGWGYTFSVPVHFRQAR